jgi:hypothetical protein
VVNNSFKAISHIRTSHGYEILMDYLLSLRYHMVRPGKIILLVNINKYIYNIYNINNHDIVKTLFKKDIFIGLMRKAAEK